MKKLLLILVIMVWPFSAWGATYYVSNANPVGSDSNNGSSPSTPWLTLSHALSTLTGTQSDTSLLLNRGNTFREQANVLGSGTSGHPFIIGAYGTGANPIVDGTAVLSGSWSPYSSTIYHTAFSAAVPYVVFADGSNVLKHVASVSAMSAGTFYVDTTNHLMYLQLSDGSSPSGHTIEYTVSPAVNYGLIYLGTSSYITIQNLAIDRSNFYGISTNGGASNSGITIQNCTFNLNFENDVNDEPGSTGRTNWTVMGNTFSNGGIGRSNGFAEGVAVSIGGTNGFTVANNTVTNQGGEGLQTVGGDSNGNVYGNTINGTPYIGIYIGAGYCGGSTSHVNCYGNYVSNAAVQDYTIASETSGDNMDHIGLYYNIGIATTEGLLFGNGTSGTTITNSLIANNVIYGGSYGIVALGPTTDASNTFRNNIFWPSISWGCAWYLQDNTAHYSPDYDLLYGNQSNLINWGGTSYATLAAFQSATGLMKHSKSANPLFANAAGGDFHLQTGSPAIKAGVNVGLTQDFYGNTVPQGVAPDIGACEVSTSTLQAPTGVKLIN